MAGEVSFRPSQADWVQANKLWYAHNRLRRWVRWFGFAMLFFMAGDIAIDSLLLHLTAGAILADLGWMIAAVLLLLGLPYLNALLLPRVIRRQFAQRPSMGDELTCRWDDHRLLMATRTGNSDQPWGELHRQLRDERSFVFLLTDRMMLLVPRRVLTAEQAADLAATADRFGPAIG